MLVVEELTCRFGSKTAVDKASFSIPRGSFIGVIGRSGAGTMGLPVRRSSTNRLPVLVGCRTAGTTPFAVGISAKVG